VRVGVDVGGTTTDAVAIDAGGRVLARHSLPTGHGAGAVLESTVDAVARIAAELDLPARAFGSLGVGVPGAVDSASGRVTHAVNLGVETLELGTELTSRLGVSARVENDVNAAALGAYSLQPVRDGAEAPSMAYLNLGTGLAAGLVLRGQLWRGSRGGAGEIGHIPLDPHGPLCGCGQRGCLEALASGSAIARLWPTASPRPVQALFDAADEGNRDAIAVRDRLTQHIASAVRVLVLTVDVDAVVIGGGVSSLGPRLLEGVQAALDAGAKVSPFLASLELSARVRLLPEGFPAAGIGAALVGAAAAQGAAG
jgi:glucokinase